MKTQHLFCKENCISIEDKYGKHIVYRAFRSPCLTIGNEARNFALHPSDLFYQSIYTIDLMKEMSIDERKGYCHYQLWEDLNAHFVEKMENADKEDIRMGISLVMQAVAEWMIRLGSEHLQLVMLLKEQMDESVSFRLNDAFRHGFRCVKEEEFTKFISAYMKSDEWISDEIHMLLEMTNEESGSEVKSALRIADGKKRFMAVLLKAAIDGGAVVDENGKRPKNTYKAVNEIFRLAFGENKSIAIAQTIRPSNDTDIKGSMENYIEELASQIRKNVK